MPSPPGSPRSTAPSTSSTSGISRSTSLWRRSPSAAGGAASDPYVSTSTRTQLDEVGDWWHANRPMASLSARHGPLPLGQIRFGRHRLARVLCSGDFSSGGGHYGGAYGVTQVYGTYPLQFWDQWPRLTRWDTTPALLTPTATFRRSTTVTTARPAATAGPPRIRTAGQRHDHELLHICSGGYGNINLAFHQRCIDEQMLPEINGAACLTSASTFLDVPPSHPFFSYVETLVSNGVTGGCAPSYYCPDSPVTRAQMAVFLLKVEVRRGPRSAARDRHRVCRRPGRLLRRRLDRGARRTRRDGRLRKRAATAPTPR